MQQQQQQNLNIYMVLMSIRNNGSRQKELRRNIKKR
jgi:hypothetical protein